MSQHLPQGLLALIASLERLAVVENEKVIEIMANLDINESELLQYQTFDHSPAESYGRKLLFKNNRFEIYLMSWNPGDITTIHNHGATQWGCVLFFGTATHRLYAFNKNKLELKNTDTFYKGQLAPVCGDLIHLMGNYRHKPFCTLHLYGCDDQHRKQMIKEKVFLPEHGLQYENSGAAFLKPTTEDIQRPQPLVEICHHAAMDYLKLAKPFYTRNGKEQTILNAMEMYNKTHKLSS